eukprot:9204974-Alexandrium_andersonii.AAC.1
MEEALGVRPPSSLVKRAQAKGAVSFREEPAAPAAAPAPMDAGPSGGDSAETPAALLARLKS